MSFVSLGLGVLATLACAGTSAVALAGTTPAARSDEAGASVAIPGLPPLPAWRALFEAARRRHALWGDAAFPVPVEEGPVQSPPPPVLAPPALVREALANAPADPDLASAILASRRASLVYRGLASLDEPTLAVLSSSPGLTRRIAGCCAEAFAAFGGRLRVQDGRLAVPGSAEAWEALVGERVASPAAFLLALLGAVGGRQAHLYDTLARLEPARLRFAIGPDGR